MLARGGRFLLFAAKYGCATMTVRAAVTACSPHENQVHACEWGPCPTGLAPPHGEDGRLSVTSAHCDAARTLKPR